MVLGFRQQNRILLEAGRSFAASVLLIGWFSLRGGASLSVLGPACTEMLQYDWKRCSIFAEPSVALCVHAQEAEEGEEEEFAHGGGSSSAN